MPRKKMVNKIDVVTGLVLATYESGNEAMRQTGIQSVDISMCCRGKLKSAGGFRWEFSDQPSEPVKMDVEEIKPVELKTPRKYRKRKPVVEVEPEPEEIKEVFAEQTDDDGNGDAKYCQLGDHKFELGDEKATVCVHCIQLVRRVGVFKPKDSLDQWKPFLLNADDDEQRVFIANQHIASTKEEKAENRPNGIESGFILQQDVEYYEDFVRFSEMFSEAMDQKKTIKYAMMGENEELKTLMERLDEIKDDLSENEYSLYSHITSYIHLTGEKDFVSIGTEYRFIPKFTVKTKQLKLFR